MTTTCFDYDGDTLAGEEVLAPPAASQGFGGFASRAPAPSRGSPVRDSGIDEDTGRPLVATGRCRFEDR